MSPIFYDSFGKCIVRQHVDVMPAAFQFACQGTLWRHVPSTVPMNHQHPHRLGVMHRAAGAVARKRDVVCHVSASPIMLLMMMPAIRILISF